MDGGEGEDSLDYSSSTAGVSLDSSLGKTSDDGFGNQDTFENIESFWGSNFDDNLSGKETDTSIEIWRNAVDGDVRNYEQFRGEAGNDFIDGRGGYDEVSYTTSPTGLTIDLRSNSVDDGFGTSDTINNIEGVEGSKHNDIIVGNDADNSLDGRFGNNHIDGGDGFDFVEYNGSGRENVIVNLLTGEASFDKAGGSEQYQDTLLNIEGVIGSTNDDIITETIKAIIFLEPVVAIKSLVSLVVMS